MKNILICLLLLNYSLNQQKIRIINSKNNNNYDMENNSSSKKNLILGIIHNYSLKRILPFFKSLIYTNITNCDIIMFVRNVSPAVINYLNKINVIVYKINKEYKEIKPTHIRWKLYFELLKEKVNQYNLVFSADVRDTIFQKDIFSYYENYSSFLGITLEDGTLSDEWNKNNIINYVGENIYKTIENERIICMGTLLGTLLIFMNFSKIIWNKLKSSNFPPSDQCVANCLLYIEKVLKNYLVKSDNKGPIMTLAISKSEDIILDFENNVLNYNNKIAAVIHQYDRIKFLKKIINMKYHFQYKDLIISGLDIHIYKIIFFIFVLIILLITKKHSKKTKLFFINYFKNK